MCLESAEQPVGKHEDALADGDARFAGKAPIHLGHDTGKLLMADEHRADSALMIVECVVEPAHVAAGDAEDHVDPSLLQHADNTLGRPRLSIQQLTGHGFVNSRYMAKSPDGIEPFASSLGRVRIHHKPSDTSVLAT